MNCRDCKHWDSAVEQTDKWPNALSAVREGLMDRQREKNPDGPWQDDYAEVDKAIVEWGECTAILQKENAPDGAKAMLSDGSGYWAALATKADFGCVLWDSKDHIESMRRAIFRRLRELPPDQHPGFMDLIAITKMDEDGLRDAMAQLGHQ